MNGLGRSELTPLHTVAIFTKAGKMRVLLSIKFLSFELYMYVHEFLVPATFIFPDLVNIATVCSSVSLDLTALFKLPG